MRKSNVKLEEAIEYVNTMYHNKMNNDEEFTDLELASVRLLRERTLNKYEVERLNNIINNFDKWLEEQLMYFNDNNGAGGFSTNIEDLEIVKDKLQELKGSDK